IDVCGESVGSVPDESRDTLERGLWHTHGRQDWSVTDGTGLLLATKHPDLDIWLVAPDGSGTDCWGYHFSFALHVDGKTLDLNATVRDFNQHLLYDRYIRSMLTKSLRLEEHGDGATAEQKSTFEAPDSARRG